MEKNRITELFGIKYPIVQGGMVWCSGWRLASAVSNAGGLGLLGAGSMHPETLPYNSFMFVLLKINSDPVGEYRFSSILIIHRQK